jgi:single-stranded-DNA-specific exonuclease
MEIEKVEEFKLKLNEAVKSTISVEALLQEVNIDSRLKFSEITPKFLKILEQFSPFGPGNMRPLFLSENVRVINTPRVVGSNHLLLSLRQENSDKVFDCIGFNLGEYCEPIMRNGSEIDVVFSIDKTVRDGRIFPQFKLKDIRICASSASAHG